MKNGYIEDFISGKKVKATSEEVEAVQVFAKQLFEDYNYPKEHIQTKPQFRVKARPSDTKKEYPVDIAVFKNGKKQEDDIYIIVECKKKNREDGKSQLQDYLRFSKAYLGVWFNGEKRLFLRKVEKNGRIEFEEIPNIPQFKQRIEDIGKFKRKDLKPTHNLKAAFKAIRNHLAANTIGATRDEVLAQQLINLIFCKIYDEKFTKQNDIVSFRAGIEESAADIKKRILKIFAQVKKSYQEVLDKSDYIDLDDYSIAYVVGELQNYSLMEAERDVIADAFEVFIGHALIETLKYVWQKIEEKGKEYNWSQIEINKEKQKVAADKFRGIDKDYFLSKVTKAYMTLIGDGTSSVVCDDSLEAPKNWKEITKQKIQLEKFDVLLTNPPFGSKIPVRGEDKLKQFEFGYKWKFDKEGNKWIKKEKLKEQEEPQVLFIEQEKGNLFAIVELPFETFSPNVTINTSVLFIQKGKSDKKNIFISINKYCGHDKKGRPTEKNELPLVADFYKNKKSDKNNFFIKPSLLENNFVAKRYLKKYIDNLNRINRSKYPVFDLGDIIVSAHNGANIEDASIYVEKKKGIPYILVKSITKEGINFENLKYINKSLESNKAVFLLILE
ncbi:MAG: type I restriction enzyme HsdR N-terminal domain-containing protein [Deltaproteobacteria bacterium]|nr:type I restriction enzyme HsdR N-terminal domain-containing protein [Deltaproteobacteria bacterium]